MRNFSTLLLLFMLPVMMVGQVEHSVDMDIGLMSTYRNLRAGGSTLVQSQIVEKREAGEAAALSWRIGAHYNRQLSRQAVLRVGLRLMRGGYLGEKVTDIRWPGEFGPDGWVPDPDLPREVRFSDQHFFFEIPVSARFIASQKRLAPFLEVGFSPALYMTTRMQVSTDRDLPSSFEGSGVQRVDIIHQLHLLGHFSLGAEYRISDRYSLFLQPTLSYHLTELATGPISEHIYHFGVASGVRRAL